MLHHHDRVAQIPQPAERGEQALVVMLVQTDRRLVEHVEDAGQTGADLRRQADPLRLASGQRRGAAGQRQVADADIAQETHPVPDLAQHPVGDERFPLRQLKRVEEVERAGEGEVDTVGHGPTLDLDRPTLRPQALARAVAARPARAVRLQRLLLGTGSRGVAAAEVRDDPFEVTAERVGPDSASNLPPPCTARGLPFTALAVLTEQQQLALPTRELAERPVEVDAVILGKA